MSDLGDLLVALHGGPRFRTLRGTVRSWQHLHRWTEALERASRDRRHSFTLYGAPETGPQPDTVETLTRVWLELPDRARSESELRKGTETIRSSVVVDGDTWWSIDGAGEVLTNGGDPGHQHGLGISEHLLDPCWWTLAGAVLEPGGRVDVAGRPCLVARLHPRPSFALLPAHGPSMLDWGGDRELAVDVDAGIVLRDTRSLDGEPFAIEEFVDVAFDEPIDPAVLTFEPPPGASIVLTPTHPTRTGPLHEIAESATFTVFAARAVPSSWTLACHLHEGFRNAPGAVVLHYATDDARARVTVTEQPARGPDERAPDGSHWSHVGDFRTWEPAEGDWPTTRHVSFVRDGTRVELASAELDLEALVAFAETFEPAPVEPPRPA